MLLARRACKAVCRGVDEEAGLWGLWGVYAFGGLCKQFSTGWIIPRMKHMGRGGGCGGARRCNDRPAANLRGVIPVVA